MATEPELWAARDGDGRLWLFDEKPRWKRGNNVWMCSTNHGAAWHAPDALLPDLKPGEKCRVRLVTCEDGE